MHKSTRANRAADVVVLVSAVGAASHGTAPSRPVALHPARARNGAWSVLSDAAVISSSLEEPEHFGEIYDRHVGAIHRYLARRVGLPHADDLAADVFLVAFKIRRRYDTDQPDARPWLYGVATNLIHRHRRAERAYCAMLARSAVDPLTAPDHADAVTGRVTAAAQAREAATALEKLSSKERDVLLLFAWAELSYEQIAAALDIPVGTVRSRLNRARTRLQQALHTSGGSISWEEVR